MNYTSIRQKISSFSLFRKVDMKSRKNVTRLKLQIFTSKHCVNWMHYCSPINGGARISNIKEVYQYHLSPSSTVISIRRKLENFLVTCLLQHA